MGDDAQDKFGQYAVEAVSFTTAVKEALAYPVRSKIEDRRIRIPYSPAIRADLRSVTKQVTAAGNIRFTAERTPDGHADHFGHLRWRSMRPAQARPNLATPVSALAAQKAGADDDDDDFSSGYGRRHW